MWVKSMPLLGITTNKEVIARDLEMCKNDPVMQSEILTKTFNLSLNNYLSYFTNEEWGILKTSNLIYLLALKLKILDVLLAWIYLM
jgi:phage terminase large subunit-like protein